MNILKSSLALILVSLASISARAGDWTTVPSPSVGQQANSLAGVAAVEDDNVWAVGWEFDQPTQAYRTVIEHWTGARWSVVRSPNATTGWNFLNAIAVTSANDIWAVGQAATGSISATMIQHWDGRRWQIVPSPSIPGVSNTLAGVSVISANDIWAVGYTLANGIFNPLSLHWNGAAWSLVAIPGQARLVAVDGVASNDVWATGETEPGEQSLTMHWNGSAWSVVPSPNDSSEDNILFGVTAIASNDVWAVGSAGSLKTLAIHWDGSQWNLVPTPAIAGSSNPVFAGIVALAPNDIWSVGQYLVPLLGSAEQTLTEHWDGASWTVVSSPNAKNSNNRLAAVTVTPGNVLWSVGTVGRFAKPEKTLTIMKTP